MFRASHPDIPIAAYPRLKRTTLPRGIHDESAFRHLGLLLCDEALPGGNLSIDKMGPHLDKIPTTAALLSITSLPSRLSLLEQHEASQSLQAARHL